MNRLRKVTQILKDVPTILLVLVLAVGCTTLPEYARPRMVPVGTARDSAARGFVYRQLTVADFKATSLPKAMSAHEARINAHSCIQIRPVTDTSFSVAVRRFSQTTQYFGSIERVGFEAVLIPECSWWNPRMPKKMRSYVLQHEQIHFAISELAARKLTRKAQKTAQSYLAIGPTQQEVMSDLRAKVKALLKEATTESLKEHTAFDEDTSMSPNPRQQRWWHDDVTARLKKTEVAKVGDVLK